MAYRINHLNKKTGITYVYESISYWDKTKKQPRSKQVCIGKLSKDTGEFIPSKRLNPEQAAARDPMVTAHAQIIGPNIILDTITKELGLDKLLQKCCPDYYQQVIAMAYYLVHQGDALSHCENWCASHMPNIASTLSSHNISNILDKINIRVKQTFMAEWISQNSEDDHMCYDITSISLSLLSLVYYKNNFSNISSRSMLFVVVICCISGIASTVNVLSGKELYKKGVTARVILKYRFIAIVAITLILQLWINSTLHITKTGILNTSVLSIAFIILQTFCFQKGIE